jgi:biotin carboxyl carrier protein
MSYENKPYKAEILSADFNHKTYTIKVNNSYTVAISNDLDQLIHELGFEVGLTKQINAISAYAGLILEISVIVGQTVKENDSLLILEAMKMENSFLSPRDGIIKSISVILGDAVDKGQLLMNLSRRIKNKNIEKRLLSRCNLTYENNEKNISCQQRRNRHTVMDCSEMGIKRSLCTLQLIEMHLMLNLLMKLFG